MGINQQSDALVGSTNSLKFLLIRNPGKAADLYPPHTITCIGFSFMILLGDITNTPSYGPNQC